MNLRRHWATTTLSLKILFHWCFSMISACLFNSDWRQFLILALLIWMLRWKLFKGWKMLYLLIYWRYISIEIWSQPKSQFSFWNATPISCFQGSMKLEISRMFFHVLLLISGIKLKISWLSVLGIRKMSFLMQQWQQWSLLLGVLQREVKIKSLKKLIASFHHALLLHWWNPCQSPVQSS